MIRLIPVLLLSEEGFYKTTNFSNPKYIGDPINIIKIFNEKYVDEIAILDISVTSKALSINYELIKDFVSECFSPIAYGGGIKTLDDADRIFNIGVEKIILQSAHFLSPKLITEIANKYGSQSVVISIDIYKNIFGKIKIYNYEKYYKGKITNINQYIKSLESLGAGELLIQSVDKDGTLKGPDLNSIKSICKDLSVPMIYAGGVRSLNDVKNVYYSGSQGIGVGAWFVYSGPHNAVLVSYPSEEEMTKLYKI